jgi:hypothetical protein
MDQQYIVQGEAHSILKIAESPHLPGVSSPSGFLGTPDSIPNAIRIEGSIMRALYDSRRSCIVTVAGTEEFVERMSLLYAPGCFIVHRRRLDGFLPWRRKQRGSPENMV